ncbi:MAG: T9SS type A sorting domain-containing protein [Flavobacteriales bacterium]|nr:T9SS type A sorting domain-containing protein [Flavobacteriales bacterium]
MNTRSLFATLCCAADLFTFLPAAQAQVFIPDQLERDWLNAEIPGIVDAGGIMDTLHPGIAELDTSMMLLYSLPTNVELRGVAYLDALTKFQLYTSGQMTPPTEASTISIEALPPGLRTLHVGIENANGVEILLPQLPAVMDQFYLEDPTGFTNESVSIAAMPQQIEHFKLLRHDNLSWTGECQVSEMEIRGAVMHPTVLLVPAIFAEHLVIAEMTMQMVDLSQMATLHLTLNSCQINGTLLWPDQLTRLTFNQGDVFGSIAAFPEGLEELTTSETLFTCLPTLPESLTYFISTGMFFPCFPNWPVALVNYALGDYTPETAIYCSVLNSTCPNANPGIAGRVFVDSDSDGAYDVDEPALPLTQVSIQPGGQTTGCNADGTYEMGVLPGNYTVTAQNGYPYIQSITPATHAASLPALGMTDLNNDFAVTLTPGIQDLRVSLYAEPARPGFDNRLYITCQNYGTTTVDATLILNYDGDQSWVASSLAPSSSAGTTATWSIPAMPIGTTTTISVDLNTAASVALGTDIEHMLSADPIATDETPANNTTQFTDSVVGSFDPNDKLLQPSVLSPAQVQLEEKPIEYTIRFQNTGTFLAERVVILDTLSEDLQWASMQFIASSHACHWYITDGVLHVIHNDIMLPDSTSDEANSHGFVKFSMLPANDLQDGAEVVNIAHIVFDFNAPIITPPAVFTVDVEAGVEERSANNLTVFPNPAKDLLHVGTPTHTRGVITYTVEDILGKRLLQGTLGNAAQIAVGGLANGVYNLTIHGGGQREVVRFVKE